MTRDTLDRIAGVLDQAVTALAARCAPTGRIDPALADENQLVAYEISLVHADMLAAATCADLPAWVEEVDRDLALAFLGESCASVLGRLEEIYLGLGLDLSPLFEIRESEAFLSLRKESSTPEFLGNLGKRVIRADAGVGTVHLDEIAQMAAETFGRFASEVVAPLAGEIHRKDLTVPETLLGPMRQMGVFGLSIPEKYGGSAGERENTPMMIAVTEALSEASLAAAGSLITRPEILARALLAGGSEEQKQMWLPRIAAGDPLCAIAITEPDFGSDVASLSLKATRTRGGWLLNGAKTWCTFAGKAGVLMVVARTDPDVSKGHRGLSVLLVEKPSCEGHQFRVEQDDGGTLEGRAIATIGYRGMHSFDLAFEDFFVPDYNVIGGEEGLGKGFYLTMAGMTGGRIQTAGRALGLMRASLKAAIAYARERNVFGQSLANYQLTQVKLAKMAARYVACRRLAFDVGKRLDTGGDSGEASVAKLIACRSAEIVSREALQIHGGMGYAEETPVSRYYVDARVLSIFEGAEETLALKVVARGLMDAKLKELA